jgi:transcriptional regulator with XRE-family HTH domain
MTNHLKARNVKVGELIRGYRTAAGLTQEELSEKAEISVRAVRNLELGLVRLPRHGTLQRIAVALGLDPDGTAHFIEVARHSIASSPPQDRSLADVVTRSPACDCLAELVERMPKQSGTIVLVVQMFAYRGHAGSGTPPPVDLRPGPGAAATSMICVAGEWEHDGTTVGDRVWHGRAALITAAVEVVAA